MPLSPGEILNNRYRIVRLLGQGGFGVVYRAWDLNLDASCAIKENLDTSQQAIRQFKIEASLLYKLRHPGLPKVTDHFSIQGQGQYLMMEFIEGGLTGETQQRRWSPLRVRGHPMDNADLRSSDQLAFPNNPIIHRDIKPANFRITPNGSKSLLMKGKFNEQN